MRSIIRFVLKNVFQLLFRVRTTGMDRSIDTSKLLVIANHESFLDGLLLGLFLPFDPVFVVHTGITRNFFFRLILSQVDYLAVDPTSPMAIKKIIKLIESGRPVVIFPEGRITVTGSLMKVYEGPAFVAARTGATILPVRLDGPARSYFSRISGKYPRRMFPRVTISALPTTVIPMPAGEALRKRLQHMLSASPPRHTLYSGMLDAISIYGRSRRVLEDIKQIEYS